MIAVPVALTAIFLACMPPDAADDDERDENGNRKGGAKDGCRVILWALIGCVWITYFSPIVIGLAYYGF